MIAADTSALIGFLKGDPDPRVRRLSEAVRAQALWLPPPVVTEMIAGAYDRPQLSGLLDGAPLLPLIDGYWDRAAETRRVLLAKGLKAQTLDTLIAQFCIDSETPLLTLDSDFRHFATHCGLKLA